MMPWVRRLLAPAHLNPLEVFNPAEVPVQAVLPVVELLHDLADRSLEAAEFRHRWSQLPLHDHPSLEPLRRIAENYLHARDSRDDWLLWGGSSRARTGRKVLRIYADELRRQLRRSPRTPADD